MESKKDIEQTYFTPSQVATHNAPNDCWLSWNGYVYNLTELCLKNATDPLLTPILKNAGKDISHWFDPKTNDIKSHINPLTGASCPYTPEGRFLHVPPPLPRTDWNPVELDQTPWWTNITEYRIGKLSKRTRKIIITNTLTKQSHTLEVAGEEKITAIQERYTAYNSHAKGYMWKRLGGLLDMNATLEGNGIADLQETFEAIGMDEEQWLPVIHLYFSDDLTVA